MRPMAEPDVPHKPELMSRMMTSQFFLAKLY
jgi:hypothetical protein